jgi:hypothetical protein
MGLHLDDIDSLLEPELTSDLAAVPVEQLRTRRERCDRAEFALSYVRRVLQGELDIVAAELAARGRGVRGDTGRLIEDLPTILAGTGAVTPSPQRDHEPRLTMAGGVEDWTAQSQLDLDELVAEVLSVETKSEAASHLVLPGANLGAFADEELRSLAESLLAAEKSVSARRRLLHDEIDKLQAEIVARYKVGAADPDSLLN